MHHLVRFCICIVRFRRQQCLPCVLHFIYVTKAHSRRDSHRPLFYRTMFLFSFCSRHLVWNIEDGVRAFVLLMRRGHVAVTNSGY